jgi:ankyrin repeat protein
MAKKSLNSIDSSGYTELMNACLNGGSIETARLLLLHGADVNFARKDDQYTALMLACSNGLFDIAELLIAWGADVSLTNEYDGTALLIACCNRYPEIAKLLLENGANVNSTDIYGLTSLMAVCNFTGDIEMVKLLLDNGADVNCVDNKYNLTALMIAYYRGAKDIVQLLLEKNPEVTITPKVRARLEEIRAQDYNNRLDKLFFTVNDRSKEDNIIFPFWGE